MSFSDRYPDPGSMPSARLTPELIASMEEKVGIELRIDHSVYNEEATRMAMLRFAEGIGDANPLWTDPEYAAGSRYGGLVAPPSFVIGCFSGIQFGWPGLGSFHSSSECVFLEPVRVGDSVRATCRYLGFEGPRPSKFAGRMVVDTFLNTYTNQTASVVATIKWRVVNFEREAARAGGPSRLERQPHPWSLEEVLAIEQEVLAQNPRGREPRVWGEVKVGDQLAPLTKGVLTMTDEIAFVAGGGAPIPRLSAHQVALRMYQRHPQWAFRDAVTKAPEPIYAVHYNKAAAQAMGVGLQYDVGFQRQCWQLQLLTNWAGDDGWVKAAYAEYRGFVYLGDVVRLGGRVDEVDVDDDGDHVVRVTTWAHNQHGDDVMPGRAVIRLPDR